jgi:hypothetical protein
MTPDVKRSSILAELERLPIETCIDTIIETMGTDWLFATLLHKLNTMTSSHDIDSLYDAFAIDEPSQSEINAENGRSLDKSR